MTDLAQWALAAPQEHARRLGSTATQVGLAGMALGLTPHTAARVGGGHELEVHEVFTLDGDSCGCLLLCTTCGAYSGARGRNLL
eukprot:6425573-Amphidinium_carterae.1